jgi:hypothetical protein
MYYFLYDTQAPDETPHYLNYISNFTANSSFCTITTTLCRSIACNHDDDDDDDDDDSFAFQ